MNRFYFENVIILTNFRLFCKKYMVLFANLKQIRRLGFLFGETMKIDRDYGLVASYDELNIYRRLDKQQKYNKKHKKASKRKSNTDKCKDAFYDDRKWR